MFPFSSVMLGFDGLSTSMASLFFSATQLACDTGPPGWTVAGESKGRTSHHTAPAHLPSSHTDTPHLLGPLSYNVVTSQFLHMQDSRGVKANYTFSTTATTVLFTSITANEHRYVYTVYSIQ